MSRQVNFLTHVYPHEDYTLTLTFASGEQRLFDAKPYLDAPAFATLRDFDAFSEAYVVDGSLSWPQGADLGWDMLYACSEQLTEQTTS